jgi:hypothetical protein
MTIIDQKLIHEAQAIFDDLGKWNAILDLERLRPEITKHWLAIGTKRLRQHFDQNPSEGWRWAEWGASTDTRWYLEKFGSGSLPIGFGWSYEFHLHLSDFKRFNPALIDELLKKDEYAPLLMHFDAHSKVPTRSGSKASKYPDFTFFSVNDEGTIPIDELAWHAAHQPEAFIKEAACMIEMFTRDKVMTRLLTKLNVEAETKPSST